MMAIWVLRLVISGVFIYAAIPKIWDPQGFSLAVFHYQLVPHSAVNLAALILPWIEFLAAICLLAVRSMRDVAAVVLGGLLLLFIGAIGINLLRGVDIACGCFSVNATRGHIGALSILRNAVLLAGCVILYIGEISNGLKANRQAGEI